MLREAARGFSRRRWAAKKGRRVRRERLSGGGGRADAFSFSLNGLKISLPCASSALGPFSDRIDPLKRLRLCSTSSTTTINGIALAADSDNDCPLQKPLRRPPTLAELELENGEESNVKIGAHSLGGMPLSYN